MWLRSGGPDTVKRNARQATPSASWTLNVNQILVGVSLAFALVILFAGPVGAATSIGETRSPNQVCATILPFEAFQTQRAADGANSYAVASAGVITSWSFAADHVSDVTLTMRVFRPTQTTGSYTVVADGGPVQTVTAGFDVATFSTRVPVHAGDIVGVLVTNGNCALGTGQSQDVGRTRSTTPATPVGATANYALAAGFQLDIAAQLEPDLDGDGYGDETQDACPQLPSTQTACPTPRAIFKKTPISSPNHTAQFKFTSDVAGATFECKLDDHPYKTCASPHSVTVRRGRHTFKVRARANQVLGPASTAWWRVF